MQTFPTSKTTWTKKKKPTWTKNKNTINRTWG